MKKLAVTTDYSANAQCAVDYACEMAHDLGASLTIIHTYDIWIPVSEVPVATVPIEEIELENKKKLEAIIAGIQIKYKINVDYVISSGALTVSLNEIVQKRKIDLVLMGMKGGGELSKHLFGSNTINVIDEGVVPVLVVPEGCKYKKVKKYALAADLKKTTDHSFEILRYLIKRFDANLMIFNVIESNQIPQIKEAIEGIKLDAVFEDINHDYYFPQANEINVGIERFIYHKEPDVLVMIPRKHGFLFKLFFEGETEKIIYNSKIPVLALA
jgi:nucleotide-binding universal stress UspA family protein